MDLSELLKLLDSNVEDEIIKSIESVNKELEGLTKEGTCLIYSDYITRSLRDKDITTKRINTKYFDYPYEHQFNLVPFDNDNYYLIDLCFGQFKRDDFPSLVEDGYMIVDDSYFNNYMKIVGNSNKNISLKEVKSFVSSIKK